MKKLFGLCLAIVIGGIAAHAQSAMPDGKMDSKMKDCVCMKDGKMMVMKSGMSTMLLHDTTLGHKTMVMMDGTVKMKDGTTHMLKEGEYVTPNGKVMTDKMGGSKM